MSIVDHPAQRVCVLCGWAPPDGTDVHGACARCLGSTRVEVAELREMYGTLSALLVPGPTPAGDRVGGTPTPGVPGRLDVLNARGPVAAILDPGRDQTGPLSIPTVLAATRQCIREWVDLPSEVTGARRYSTDYQVRGDARFIHAWLDPFAQRASAEAVQSVAALVHESREHAWTLCGYRAARVHLGPCPREVAPGQTCGRPLWVDPTVDREVHCPLCGYVWSRRWWMWIQEAAEVGT